MHPVSATDRLVQIIRQRLKQRSSEARSSRPSPSTRQGGLASVRQIARTGQLDDPQLKRALVEGLLADQLGETLVNEARFQQIVERVTEALFEDAQADLLMDKVLGELRGASL